MPALGRLVEHDERSRLYQAARAHTQRSVLWGHHAPVLDQGELGSCTGNAAAQLINTDYFKASRPHGYLTELDAVQLYELATHLDGIKGNTYPPIDGGSSGLGAAKAGVKLKYFTGYKHAFGFDHFTATLQLQPVIVGTSWYDGMFTPSSIGFVRPTGTLAGGHEYLCLGLSWETKTLTFLNSWSSSWGPIGGRFLMHFADFQALLADQGDVTAPLPKAA
jgi:hypothetical protein